MAHPAGVAPYSVSRLSGHALDRQRREVQLYPSLGLREGFTALPRQTDRTEVFGSTVERSSSTLPWVCERAS